LSPFITAQRPGRTTSLAILVCLALGCSSDNSHADRFQVEEGVKAVNGIDLYYKALGSGEPIIVIHGGPGLEHSYLLPWLEPLSDRHQVILYDQRGLGRSTGQMDSSSINMDNFIADLDGLRESFGIERVNLLAHSWGGLLAMMYAWRHPDRVRSLVLVSTVEPGKRYEAEMRRNQLARRTPHDSLVLDSLSGSQAFQDRAPEAVNQMMWTVFRSTFGDTALAQRLVVDFQPQTARNLGPIAALLMGPLGDYDFWDRLSDISAPTLVLHGDADPIPVTMARELAESIPNAQFVAIEGAGHFPFVEKPDEVTSRIEEFLQAQHE
jgi:proline iminopeptidase